MSMKLVVEDEVISGKQVRVQGILYLEDVDGSSGGTDDGTQDGTDNNEGETPPVETPDDPEPDNGYQCDGNTEIIGYGELKTLINIRAGNASDAPRITTYRKDTIVPILEFCSNGWLRIVCVESSTGYAYVCNENDAYVTVGKRIYTVMEGDTIKTVAEKTLGSQARYEEIKLLNGMKDNVIMEGMILLIP